MIRLGDWFAALTARLFDWSAGYDVQTFRYWFSHCLYNLAKDITQAFNIRRW